MFCEEIKKNLSRNAEINCLSLVISSIKSSDGIYLHLFSQTHDTC